MLKKVFELHSRQHKNVNSEILEYHQIFCCIIIGFPITWHDSRRLKFEKHPWIFQSAFSRISCRIHHNFSRNGKFFLTERLGMRKISLDFHKYILAKIHHTLPDSLRFVNYKKSFCRTHPRFPGILENKHPKKLLSCVWYFWKWIMVCGYLKEEIFTEFKRENFVMRSWAVHAELWAVEQYYRGQKLSHTIYRINFRVRGF